MSLLSQSTQIHQQQRQVQRQQLSQQTVQQLQLLQLPLAALTTELRQRAEQNPFITYEPPLIASPMSDLLTPEENPQESEDYFCNRFEGYGENRDPKASDRHEQFLLSLSAPETLYQHLERQVLENYAPGPQRDLLLFLCDAVDTDGYLRHTPHALLQDWWEAHQGRPALSEEHDIVEAIRELQTLDPAGVGARSLAECLELQVRADPTPSTERLTRIKLCHRLTLLDAPNEAPERTFARLAKLLHCTPEEVAQALAYLRTLNPYPGRAFASEPPPEPPEVRAIRSATGHWIAQCNDESLPIFKLNEVALDDAKSAVVAKDDLAWVNEYEAQARLWTEAYAARNETLRKVAQVIFTHQRDFLDAQGDPATLKPLLQKEVAETLGFDESTVSRAVKEKMVRVIPSGKLLSLKTFFTRALPTAKEGSGELLSEQQAKQALKALIDGEDAANPLSDQTLTEALTQQGFSLKRRTVAKYRESLGIPSTRERRRKL